MIGSGRYVRARHRRVDGMKTKAQPSDPAVVPASALAEGDRTWAVLGAVLDTMPAPTLVAMDDRIVLANEAMRRLLAGQQTVGRRLVDFIDRTVESDPAKPTDPTKPADAPATVFLRMKPGVLPLPARRQVVTPDGMRHALTVITAEGAEAHEPRHAALRDSEARFRAIVNALPLPVTITRLDDDRVVFVNEQWCRMAGLEPEDVIGREVTDFYVDPEDRQRLKGALSASGAVHHFVVRHRYGSRVLWVELRGVTMTFAGHPASLSVFQDVTDAKEQERLLVEAKEAAEGANRTKSEFLASMSHELRTPLNAILGFSDIIQNQSLGPVGNPRYADYARDIHASGALLLRLIDDVLDLAKMEAGKLALEEEVFDAADLAAVALRMVGPQAEVAQVTLGIEPQSRWFHLRADQRRVIQVLLNLLGNAIKYTPEGGRVSIRGDVAETGAGLLVVRDTGIGIAADDVKRIMEPFVQLESTMTRRFGGSGLGLAIARSLIEMHGGQVAIESELGAGTTVTIAFPPDRVVPQQPD